MDRQFLDEIQRRWAVPPVCVRVKILGEEKDLPADLQELVGALDPDNCIGGKVLVDLCRQRSERRGSGCDVSQPCEDLPTFQHQLLGWSINQLFR